MYYMPLNIIWIIGALWLWAVTARVYLMERQNPNTDITNGGTLLLLLAAILPMFNVFLAFIFMNLYSRYFKFKVLTWLYRPVYRQKRTQP